MSINYAHLSLGMVVILILLSCHWTACLWGLQAMFDPLEAWPGAKGYCEPWGCANCSRVEAELLLTTACAERHTCDVGSCPGGVCVGDGWECAHAFHMYSYSLYFAIMTVTVAPRSSAPCGVTMTA